MAYSIIDVEGIGPKYAETLKEAGIKTTEDLLEMCCDKKGRKETAESTGISEKHLLEWANLADLMRINGVGEEYADLLEEAGVDTVKELATRNVENLTAKMAEVNEAKNLVNKVPSESAVQKWVDEAGKLKPLISH